MKKLILFAAILFAGVSVVKAAGDVPENQKATLNVVLKAVQSISVDGDVTITYGSATDYLNGVSSESQTTKYTKLSVVSTGGFKVTVNATDLVGTNVSIPASTVSLKVAAIGSSKGTLAADDELNLQSTDALISSETGGTGLEYNVSYKGADANSYMQYYNEGDTKTGDIIYTTDVLYTISAL